MKKGVRFLRRCQDAAKRLQALHTALPTKTPKQERYIKEASQKIQQAIAIVALSEQEQRFTKTDRGKVRTEAQKLYQYACRHIALVEKDVQGE